MRNIILNHTLRFSYSEDFKILDEKERNNLQMLGEGSGMCLRSEEHHMILSFGWKEPGKLIGRLADTHDLAKNMEAKISKAMKPYGYELEEFKAKQLDGQAAEGFCYRYTAQDTAMIGESYVVKNGAEIYYLHVYARDTLREESLPVWNAILDSMHWT